MFRKLCQYKGVKIIEAEACPDHIHMLLSIPPKYSVAQILGYLKGKSSLMIFEKYANLKYKYGSRNFWCRGYYVDTVGKNKKAIQEYIRQQFQEDLNYEQLTLREIIDPFTGEQVKGNKQRNPLKGLVGESRAGGRTSPHVYNDAATSPKGQCKLPAKPVVLIPFSFVGHVYFCLV